MSVNGSFTFAFFVRIIPAIALAMSAPVFAAGEVGRVQAIKKMCSQCHGIDLNGTQELGAPAIAGLPEWYLVAQLTKFRTGVRGLHPKDFPGMRMRPMSRTIEESDVALISSHVASLPRPLATRTVTGKLFHGEKKFKEICVSCHGAQAEGNQAMNAPPLAGTNDWYLVTQLKNFKSGIRGGNAEKDPNGAVMRGMSNAIDEIAMNDIALYLSSLGR